MKVHNSLCFENGLSVAQKRLHTFSCVGMTARRVRLRGTVEATRCDKPESEMIQANKKQHTVTRYVAAQLITK